MAWRNLNLPLADDTQGHAQRLRADLDKAAGIPKVADIASRRGRAMCRNIRTLFNFEPPVTEAEIRAASLQFVRKICGFTKPSKSNEAAFALAVEQVAGASRTLLASLETHAPAKNREEEVAKAKARTALRFTPVNS
jgi:hypothetical protein